LKITRIQLSGDLLCPSASVATLFYTALARSLYSRNTTNTFSEVYGWFTATI